MLAESSSLALNVRATKLDTETHAELWRPRQEGPELEAVLDRISKTLAI